MALKSTLQINYTSVFKQTLTVLKDIGDSIIEVKLGVQEFMNGFLTFSSTVRSPFTFSIRSHLLPKNLVHLRVNLALAAFLTSSSTDYPIRYRS